MKYLEKKVICRGSMSASMMVLAMMAGFAQAEPVTTWNYSTDSIFSNSTWTGPAGSSGGFTGAQSTAAYELSWGNATGNFQVDTGNANSNRSALTIGNGVTGSLTGGGPATGSVNTTIGGMPGAGQIGTGISITHWNNPISSLYGTLDGAKITDTLTLTPTAPSYYSSSVSAPTLIFNFKFQETANAGAYGAGGYGHSGSGYCADGSLAGSHPQGCPDLFGFSNTLTLNNAFQYADSGVDGILGNADDFMRTYYASVFVLDEQNNAFPLAQLTTGECGVLGFGSSCFGFSTAEATHTTAKFAFAVTTEPLSIPEPGSLVLFGLALAGLGVLRQRKSR